MHNRAINNNLLLAILRDYNPRINGSKTTIYIDCPFCKRKHKMGIGTAPPHIFGCFSASCRSKGRLYDINHHIKSPLLKYPISNYLLPDIFYDKPQIPKFQIPIGYQPLYKAHPITRNKIKQYCENRTKIQFFKKIELGHIKNKYRNYFFFPIRHNGHIIGMVGRNYNNGEPRYFTLGSIASQTIWDYDLLMQKKPKDIIIVEGIFDKIVVDGWMKECNIDGMAIATFGCRITKEQAKLLNSIPARTIRLWYEQGSAQEKVKYRIAYKTLSKSFYVKTCDAFKQMDPGDIKDKETFLSLLREE